MTVLSDPRLVEPVMTSADMMGAEPAHTPPAPAAPGITVQPLTGAGLAMRQGDLILVCAESGIGGVVSAFADVVAAQGDGTMLVRRAAAVLAEDYAGEVAACAACGPTRDGRLAVLVYGGARAVVDTPDGSTTFSGTDDFGAVCRLVAGPVDTLRLELPGAAEPNPRTRLDVGVIVAAGVSVAFSGGIPPVTTKPVPLRRPAPEVTTPPPANGHTPPAHTNVSRAEPDGMRFTVPAHPNGTETHHPATNGRAGTNGSATRLRTALPTVRGLNCPEGHFNDPRLNYCSVCGMSMTAAGSSEHDAPRPPLGVLLLDRGGTFVVEGDIVIGREPELDRDVVVGVARPLTLDEPAQSVSRQHARISVIDWDVFVVDLGSTNGTRLQRPGEAPSRVAAHALTPITPGTIVWLGERWIRYESHRNPPGPADENTVR